MYNISTTEKETEIVKPLDGNHYYFIHSTGYVSEVTFTKERPQKNIKVQGKIYARIRGKSKLLIDLMCKHFIGDLSYAHQITYTATQDNRIPLSNILVKKLAYPSGLSEEHGSLFAKYKCQSKADSANKRGEDKITGFDVFNCLQRTKFTCIYCHSALTKEWHLDHFFSLSKNGKNQSKNLAASCRMCNLMKGALDGYQFIAQCKRISDKNASAFEKGGFSPDANLLIKERE